jgi:hypothetical protein
MSLLAPLALTVLALAPQENGSGGDKEKLPSKLTPAEQKKLADLANSWFTAWARSDEIGRDDKASAQQKEKARSDARKQEDAFQREWTAKDQKHGLLAQLGDLRAIFAGAFAYRSEPGNGEYRDEVPPKDEKAPTYGIVLPKSYKADVATRSVLLIPGYDEQRKRWVPARDWFKDTWKGSDLAKDTLFVLPRLDEKLAVGEQQKLVEDLDPVPDLSEPAQEAQEEERNTAILRPMFQAMVRFHMDRDRLVIDAGKGGCAYALRLASYFPSRFAGLVLRHPTDPGRIRLDSLNGIPVLLLVKEVDGEPGEERKAADKIADVLNGLYPGSCTVKAVKADYPFGTAAGEIGTWMHDVRRDLFKKKVTLVPNHHHWRFQSGYWVRILEAEMLHQVAEKERPAIVAEADRAANRITVTATGVSKLLLLLNDALVDLGKDVTIVVNGNAETRKIARRQDLLTQSIRGNLDPAFLWVASHEASVKK